MLVKEVCLVFVAAKDEIVDDLEIAFGFIL